MGNILLLFLVLFPMLLSAWVFPLRRRDRRYRNWLIQIIPAVELAAALLLLLWPGAALELPGVFGFGLRLQAGSLGSLLALVSAFLWAATGLNCPSYFAAAEGCNRFYFFWLLTLGALMGVFLAADLFTLFVFFEMMSFTSYVWVVQNETEEARQALHRMAKENFAILYLTEQLSAQLQPEIARYQDALTPAIILIPGKEGSLGIGMANIKTAVERAVGADIL